MIQIPTAYLLAFKLGLNTFGLWLSMPVAGLCFFLFLVNYTK